MQFNQGWNLRNIEILYNISKKLYKYILKETILKNKWIQYPDPKKSGFNIDEILIVLLNIY